MNSVKPMLGFSNLTRHLDNHANQMRTEYAQTSPFLPADMKGVAYKAIILIDKAIDDLILAKQLYETANGRMTLPKGILTDDQTQT